MKVIGATESVNIQHCQYFLNVMAVPEVFKNLIDVSSKIIQAEDYKFDVIVSMGEVGIILASGIA